MPFDMPRASKHRGLSPSAGCHDDSHFHAQAEAAAALAETRRATYGSGLHSAGIQIKDQERSKWFYTQVLGMEVVKETESGSNATMIWLAFPNPADSEGADLEFGQRRGMLQLVHVNGSETQKNFRIVHGVPGFCHFCINVIDLEESMARYKSMGVNIVEEGDNEQGWGVISDPDGYTIQLLYCKIDQSLALKRQVEEMMSVASSSRSALRSPSRSRERASSTTNASSVHSVRGLPASLSSFKGGSPDFDHPHWQVAGEEQDGGGGGGGGNDANRLVPTTSTTDASDDADDEGAAFVPGPRSRRPSHAARGDEWPPGAGVPSSSSPSSVALALSTSSSSSQLSNGKSKTPRARGRTSSNDGPPSYAATTQRSGSLSAPLSTQASNNMTRSRSGSIYRPNAPRSIDLTALQLEAQQRFTPDAAVAVEEEEEDGRGASKKAHSSPAPLSNTTVRPSSSPPATMGGKKKKGGASAVANAPSRILGSSRVNSNANTHDVPLSALTAGAASHSHSKPHKSKAHSGLKSFRDRFSFGGGSGTA